MLYMIVRITRLRAILLQNVHLRLETNGTISLRSILRRSVVRIED